MPPLEQPQAVISATVELEQRLPDGSKTVGTGFLVSDPTPDGRPRTVLVTANHVFERMPMSAAQVDYRMRGEDGVWRYAPRAIMIRALDNRVWRRDAAHDVAVIQVNAPPELAKAAIPLSWLAGADTFTRYGLAQGDEMIVLGYPEGLAANAAGFPILRSGRVASPIEASDASPSFLLDFRVFPGNSGGPVFLAEATRRTADGAPTKEQIIAGMLTEQVEVGDQRLEIGVVTDAQFIRQAIALLDQPLSADPPPAAPALSSPPASAAAATIGRIAPD